LDLEFESRILDERESPRFKSLGRELEKMWAIEEIKVRQRAQDRNILEGDRNTTYFYVVANQRARKKRIEGLQSDHGLVQDTPGILKIAVQYYKELFGWESREPFCLADNFWDACDLVFSEENSSLESPFREKGDQRGCF
jgi:hypothetical protein